MICLTLDKLGVEYGKTTVLDGISAKISGEQIVSVIGHNGSGKTTTIRHIMGFIKPQKGSVQVLGMDAWKDSCEIKKYVSYVPGEIAFPDLATGTEFLKSQAELLGLKDMSYANKLIEMLQLERIWELIMELG